MKYKYSWQGEPVEIRHTYLKVYENKEKPLFWYNYEVLSDHNPRGWTYIPAVEVTTKRGNKFFLFNMHGIAINKLTKGGWTDMYHASLPDDCEECDEKYLQISGIYDRFQHEQWVVYRTKSDAWFKKMYGDTEEYKRFEEIKKLAMSGHARIGRTHKTDEQ